jgi:hypothetical protein
MKRGEQNIQQAICANLAVRAATGIFWWHHPAGGYRSRIEAAIMKSMGAKAGLPDVLILRGGQLYGIELKAPGGRLSPAQQACHEALKAAGAKVAGAIGLDKAIEQLEQWQLLRGETQLACGPKGRNG